MAYHLKHHFDPEFDHLRLTPKEREDGSVDHLDLGYVQNAVHEQVLAEWVEVGEGEAAGLSRKYLANEPRDVAGHNCVMNPENPLQVISRANGYVLYVDGRITVKTLLNVRRDVDYHTGNIVFVGDMVVHGSVRTGFSLQAGSLRAREVVEGAQISSMNSIVCEGGIKGAGRALLESGRTIKAAFCENATLTARENVLVEGACMHSHIYAGRKFASRGRLTGGAVYCHEYAFIGGQLGGGIGASTQVMAGYDPLLLFDDQQLNERILTTREHIRRLKAELGASGEADREIRTKIERAEKRLGFMYERKSRIWQRIHDSEILDSCRIMVEGRVHPGVEIGIGPAWYKVDDYLEDVQFALKDMEITVTSPAVRK